MRPRCSRGIARAPGTRYNRAGAEPGGARAGHRRRRQRDRDLRVLHRNLQPQRTSTRASTKSLATYKAVCERGDRVRSCACAAISRTAFGCPFEGAVRPAAGRARRRTARGISASSRWRSATRSASPIRDRFRVSSKRCSPVCRPIASRSTITTRAARRSRTFPRLTPLRDRDLRRLVGRPRRCPYAPGAAGNLATDDLIYMLDGLGDRNGSVAGGGERGVCVHRLENRSPLAVAPCAGGGGATEVRSTKSEVRT